MTGLLLFIYCVLWLCVGLLVASLPTLFQPLSVGVLRIISAGWPSGPAHFSIIAQPIVVQPSALCSLQLTSSLPTFTNTLLANIILCVYI